VCENSKQVTPAGAVRTHKVWLVHLETQKACRSLCSYSPVWFKCVYLSASSSTSCTLAVVTRICPVYMNWMMPSTVSGSGPVAELHSLSSTRPDRDSENCPPSSSVKYSEPADNTERWADKVCTLSPPERNTNVTSQYSPDFLCSFCLRESSEQWVEQVNSSASSGSPSPVSARCAPLLRSSGASAAAADIPRRGRVRGECRLLSTVGNNAWAYKTHADKHSKTDMHAQRSVVWSENRSAHFRL